MELWNLSTKNILIIDDFAQMRSMLISMLRDYRPAEVVQAANGKDALDKMHKHRFDIILCDYNLGAGKDGQQILEEAKYQQLLAFDTIFIMVTAENTNQMVMGAAEYLPDAYLSKPINKNVLISRLKKLIIKKESFTYLSNAIESTESDIIIKCCDNLLLDNSKYKFEILKIKCEHLVKLKRYDEALKISQAALKERSIPWAMMIMGKIHMYNKDYTSADAIFRDIIDIDKNFMPAYDWLSKLLNITEDYSESQETLMEAIKISPKSVLRQRCLAEAAEKNNDLNQLQISRKKVVEIGRSSCLKKSDDYTRLADLYMKNNTPQNAIDILKESNRTFKNEDSTVLKNTIKLSTAYNSANNRDKYISCVSSSLKITDKNKSLLHGDTALELARNCLDLGKKEEGKKIITEVVKEYFEDKEKMDIVNKIFQEAGLEAEGEELISRARAEVIELNNKGVKLIKNGDIDEAIKLFKIAVKEMPENIAVNINIATSLMLDMQKSGARKKNIEDVYGYLDVVFRKDPDNLKALDVKKKCMDLTKIN